MLLLMISLVGCGKSVKAEKELLEDLVSSSEFHMVEGGNASDLTVIKRLTDQEKRVDTVYVEINIEHKNATAKQAYIMHYTCYNDGWRLDSIEEYYGDEVEWKIVPNRIPTNEEIMEKLIAHSNGQIELRYKEGYVEEPFSYTYFFEEGKYSSEIYSGDMISDTEYTCIVETTRIFEYMEVCQTQLLRFLFDEYNYEWYLLSDEIIWNHGTMFLDGNWKVLANGSTIRMEQTGGEYGIHAYANYNVVCGYKDKYFEFPFKIYYPTSQNIRRSRINTEDYYWKANFRIEVAPNVMWGYDYNEGYGLPIDPINVENTPSQLETTGIVDMSVGEEADVYRAVAKEFINAAFIESDFSKLEEICHPEFDYEHLELLKEDIQSENKLFLPPVHMYTEIADTKNPDTSIQEEFAYLKENGVSATELAACTYYMRSWIDGGEEYMKVWVLLAKENDKIYVVLFET